MHQSKVLVKIRISKSYKNSVKIRFFKGRFKERCFEPLTSKKTIVFDQIRS
jgi:hypothetical protein